jgi:hypothetical protein
MTTQVWSITLAGGSDTRPFFYNIPQVLVSIERGNTQQIQVDALITPPNGPTFSQNIQPGDPPYITTATFLSVTAQLVGGATNGPYSETITVVWPVPVVKNGE